MKKIAALLLLVGCAVPGNNSPPRIDVSCLIEPQTSGVAVISCADPQTWIEFYQKKMEQGVTP